jgi:hypothetical protein
VQSIEPFEPTPEEIAAAGAPPEGDGKAGIRALRTPQTFVVRVDARRCDESLIDDLKSLLEHHAGDSEVQLEMTTSAGPRKLRFGSSYRVTPTRELRSELDDLLGPGALVA